MTNEELVNLIQQGIDKQENMKQLYLQNHGLLATVVSKFTGQIEHDDLWQEAYLGLCFACDKYESCKGTNFSTYAVLCIKWHLYRYVQEQQGTVRVPEHQLALIQRYEQIKNDCILRTSKEPSDRLLMLHLGINLNQLRRLKDDVERLKIKSLDEPMGIEDDCLSLMDSIRDPADQIASVEDAIQNEQLSQILWDIVDGLEPEQSTLIREKYQNNVDSKTIADKMGKTFGEVRSIENRAFRELRRYSNRKKLKPFFNSDNEYYSAGITGSGLNAFNLTWTSAQERAVLQAEASTN